MSKAHRPIGSGVQATGATRMGTRPWAGRSGAAPEQGEAGGHGLGQGRRGPGVGSGTAAVTGRPAAAGEAMASSTSSAARRGGWE